MSRLGTVLREELDGLHVRLLLARSLMAVLPPYVGSRVRPALLRAAGFAIGRGTVMWGAPLITGSRGLQRRLTVGRECWFNVGCHLDLSAEVTIGDRVSIGQEVMILTNAHRIGDSDRRAGPLASSPVRIEDGAWLSTRCTILPGVTVGAGAVVAAGAVVTRDVAPHTLVGGVPARKLRSLAEDGADGGEEQAVQAR
jgi:maltose O-acetyltransferase